MNYYTFSPSEKLRGLVRFFWVFECDELQEPYIYRSMADPCCELLFHYNGRFDQLSDTGMRQASFLSGIHSQTSKYHRFITEEPFGIFGAYLYPFAAFRLLNLSPFELTNQMPDLSSALGKSGQELEEQIFLAANNSERYRILTDFLENRFSKHPEDRHPAREAVRFVIHSGQHYSVRDLCRHFNLSERQFERKFREYSGFTPKKYMRLVRFSDACNQYAVTNQKTLTEVAQSCGYYDQSHFIKEFRAFSGYAPAEYFTGNAEGIEWRESLQVASSK